MKRLCFAIAMIGWFIPPGCEPAELEKSTPRPRTMPADDSPVLFGGSSAVDAGPRSVNMIHLRLGTVEVPTGVASGSEELWSYLDEEPVSLQSRVLGLNGFRVGIGQAEVWSDLERTLKKMTGQTYRSVTIQTIAGRPAFVELDSNLPARTIFTFFEDGTLSGKEYPPGDSLLSFCCTLDEDDPNKVLLAAVPQIRSTRRVSRIIQEHGTHRIVSRPKLFPLTPLAFQLMVRRGSFLVIGPGIQSRRPSSPGHYFLTKIRKGMEFETILIIRPLVHKVRLD